MSGLTSVSADSTITVSPTVSNHDCMLSCRSGVRRPYATNTTVAARVKVIAFMIEIEGAGLVIQEVSTDSAPNSQIGHRTRRSLARMSGSTRNVAATSTTREIAL